MSTGMRLRRPLIVGALVAGLLTGCTQSGRLLTKGTMPPPGPDGRVDPASAPDFLAVTGRGEGIAGYVAKAWVFPEDKTVKGRPGDLPPEDPPWPVYADDLQTLVGHMVVNRGFVPLEAPSDEPAMLATPATSAPATRPTSTPVAVSAGPRSTVSLYVRNTSRSTAWIVVQPTVSPPNAVGFDGGAGNACLVVPAGGQVLVLDRSPREPGARPVHVLVTAGQVPPSDLWLDIADDGSMTEGSGVPDWWSGRPVGC